MEDAATAEISRVQVHQWLRHEVKLDDQPELVVTPSLIKVLLSEEVQKLRSRATSYEDKRALALCRAICEHFLLDKSYLPEFLTSVCYRYIVDTTGALSRL